MSYIEALLLSVIQGLTEFLPISSSAHLIIVSEFLGLSPDLFFDVSLHLGTLIAVAFYFRSDLFGILISIIKNRSILESKLLKQLFVSCLPTLLLGFLLVDFIDTYLRTSFIVAFTTIAFGLVLLLATYKKTYRTNFEETTITDAFIMGLVQTLSLIPGVSRSGITISAGLFLGLDNKTASRMSFLMSIPTISAIAIYLLIKIDSAYLVENFEISLFGLFVSFLIAYFTIDIFIRFINKIGFLPFIIYRILLGTALLLIIV